jgi:hypothetical protein
MIPRDWVKDLSADIRKEFPLTEEKLRELVKKHCPFEEGVAYEPVVDRAAYAMQLLKNVGVDVTCGACAEVAFTGLTTLGHTCERTLLICVNSWCRNTESPAGAMARAFNHRRCLHCGGAFEVLRA